MKKFIPLLFVSLSLFGESFQEFLDEELRMVNQELEIAGRGMESGLDIQQYYYIMGKRVELEKIILNWKGEQ